MFNLSLNQYLIISLPAVVILCSLFYLMKDKIQIILFYTGKHKIQKTQLSDKTHVVLYLLISTMILLILGLLEHFFINKSIQENKQVCTLLGSVEEVTCAVGSDGGKTYTPYIRCKAQLSNKQKIILKELAVKGDKIHYCQNSSVYVKNFYKIED
jgi:hypothetical protein